MKTTPLDARIARKTGCNTGSLSREHIEQYQLNKLRETLRWVRERSPYYRARLAQWEPDELASLADLARLPFTTADDIRQQVPGLLCISQSKIARVVTLQSSGTAGEQKRLFFTRDDQELTLDFFQHGMSTFVSPGQRVLILLPGERPGSVGDLLSIALQRMGADPILHGLVRDVQTTIDILRREKPDCVVGMPAQLLWLAKCSTMRGMARPRVESVLSTADHTSKAVRHAVEEAWGCELYDHYGMTEMGLGGGVECQAHSGYHPREADLYLEIVEPSTGRLLPDGERGEVVFTTLTRRGMPLIRYRTGDLGRFIAEPCPCGTRLKTLEHVKSRLDGVVSLAEGCLLTMADLDEALFPIEGLLGFKATLDRRQGSDTLTIEAETIEGAEKKVEKGIVQELSGIPALLDAEAVAELDISVLVRAANASSGPPLGKRVIEDRRKLKVT